MVKCSERDKNLRAVRETDSHLEYLQRPKDFEWRKAGGGRNIKLSGANPDFNF